MYRCFRWEYRIMWREMLTERKKYGRRLDHDSLVCMLWVALCFGLTSAVYLAWLDRLVLLAGSPEADWLSLVAGYLCQAAGTGVSIWLLRRKQGEEVHGIFQAAVLLLAVILIPMVITDSGIFLLCSGLLMNLLCGFIAGFYLYGICLRIGEKHRGIVFGGGYAAATSATGLLAMAGKGQLLHGRLAIPLCLAVAAVLLLMTSHLSPFLQKEKEPASAEEGNRDPETASAKIISIAAMPAKAFPAKALSGKILRPDASGTNALPPLLACVTVVLISAVKNLGFGFPSSDIAAGLIPEISRIPYAAGLVAAGIVTDKSRRNGMLCTIAALVIPFIMLGLTGEPVSRTVFWSLDYLFYGFFSVFRVVLFLDLADRAGRPALAPLGLLAGRLGDAAGTAVCLLLSDSRIALISISAVLFPLAVFLLFSLYQKLYEPAKARQKTEQEIFEAFCLHNDLSAREREILRLVIAGRTNGEIAEALFISENTVKYHVRNLLQKTGCKNRSELQKKYMLSLYPGLGEAGSL